MVFDGAQGWRENGVETCPIASSFIGFDAAEIMASSC